MCGAKKKKISSSCLFDSQPFSRGSTNYFLSALVRVVILMSLYPWALTGWKEISTPIASTFNVTTSHPSQLLVRNYQKKQPFLISIYSGNTLRLDRPYKTFFKNNFYSFLIDFPFQFLRVPSILIPTQCAICHKLEISSCF